jgi:hypothetical protein
MDGNQVANGTALVLSLVAVAVSTIFALRQSRLMQQANLLPVLIGMFAEFREPAFKQHLAFIETELWERCPREHGGIDDLPVEARHHVIPVMTVFAGVGMLVKYGIVDDTIAASYMRGSTLKAWSRLAPYIYNERSRRAERTYFLFFEHLASVVSEYRPDKLQEKLRLRRMPEPSQEGGRTGENTA